MKILFIGNSYTYYNDMPKIFEALAKDNGKQVQVEAVTKGGRKLYENLLETDENHMKICDLVNTDKYDVLILQEQSIFPIFDYEKYEEAVLKLISLVGAKRNILYATWGRQKGNKILEQNGWSSSEMTRLLYEAVQKASKKSGAEISPVGLCFDHVLQYDPQIELYNGDETSHPSYMGSCIVALTHYKRIYNEMPQSFDCITIDEKYLDIVKRTVDMLV